MNGVQTRFKCKLDVKRCKRFVFPPSSLLPRSNALKTKAIRYFQTDRTLTRIVSPPLLYNIANRMDSILHHAQEEKPTYPEFLSLVLGTEVEMKERKDYERRLVAARLPRKHDLDEYDYNFYEGIDRRQMKELRELVWLREAYNLILMGPSGTGKTFLAAGLVFDAVKAGYKAYLMTMEDIVNCLRLKDESPSHIYIACILQNSKQNSGFPP